jgi:hypothetical protein
MKMRGLLGACVAALLVSAALAQERTVLSTEQARDFILKKPFTVVRETGDRSIHFEFKSDGKVFQNTSRTGASTVSSSGSWHMNEENGKVCVEFTDPKTRGVCFGLIEEGSVMRLYTGKRSEPEPWGVVN